MRNLIFILSAAAILLAGAAAAGLIARAVVSPRTGEVQSAGVVTIPTVLGQTAEEVLFYPWSMYGTQPLRRFTEDELMYTFGLANYGDTMEVVDNYLSEGPFLAYDEQEAAAPLLNSFFILMPLSFRWSDLFTALEVNWDEHGSSGAARTQIFLKDFPAAAYRDGPDGEETPVTLSFALEEAPNLSISYLIRPAQPRELTEEEQTAALEWVEQDLRRMFLVPEKSELYLLLRTFDQYQGLPWGTYSFFERTGGLVGPEEQGEAFLPLYDILGDPYKTPMDRFLTAAETVNGWSTQIITTQQQIVVSFTNSSGAVFGVYYDIQLGCYSGIGSTQ